MAKNNKGSIIIQGQAVFKCIIEEKYYRIAEKMPYFIQVHETFSVIPGKIAGGTPQLMPIMKWAAVCEDCFKNPENGFEMPKEEIKSTVVDIPSLRKN